MTRSRALLQPLEEGFPFGEVGVEGGLGVGVGGAQAPEGGGVAGRLAELGLQVGQLVFQGGDGVFQGGDAALDFAALVFGEAWPGRGGARVRPRARPAVRGAFFPFNGRLTAAPRGR